MIRPNDGGQPNVFGNNAFGELECFGYRVQAEPGAVAVTEYVSYLAHG
jgi:hypothetical protein